MNTLTTALVTLWLAASVQADDPEAFMNATDMIRNWGYPVEVHDVVTDDGYILDLFRIPHGRNSGDNSSCHRPAVLMVHGIGASSPEFIINPPESGPAYILADGGFDVFLMNHRGSTYGRGHTTLKLWENKYWQFTVDEMAKYDVPAVIDKVLNITGQQKTYYIGNSQGTLVGFMTLSDNPALNRKVASLIQVGPVGTSHYSKGLFQALFWLYNGLKPFYRIAIGSHEVAFGLPWVYRPLIKLCTMIPYLGPKVCLGAVHLMFGPPAPTLNISRAPVYLSHIPGGTSTWNGLHLAQIASRIKVEHMDHSPAENLLRYGQETAPPYDYSNIDAPIYLVWGRDDWATTGEDIDKYLMKNLRKEVVKGTLEVSGYNHLDFVIDPNCGERVWKPIAQIMRRQESGMCAQ